MKIVISILLSTSFIFANSSFNEAKEYTCLHTTIIKNGFKKEVDFLQSFESPFIFTIKNKELISTDNDIFTFESKKEDEGIVLYTNENFNLFLLKDEKVSFVPKKSKEQTKYIFKCKNK